MTGDAPQRNWWGIGIALLVILTITAIISVTIVLLAPNSDKNNDNVTPLTIEDIVHPKANEVNPGIIWLSVDTFAYKDAKCNIWLVSIYNHQINRTLLIDDRSCQNRHIVSYKPSATAQYIAFSYETRQFVRQRWSTLVKVRVLNSHFDYPVGPSKTGDEFIQLFLWNSQELSNELVYVYQNNIYYQANVTAPSEQITFSGVENKISNGIADWLYEEEIFGTHKAVWWSPSGNYLAFVVFNDTQVSNITMSYYSDEPYPTNVNIPYPKVGASLPEAKVHVWNKKTKQTITFAPPDENYNQNFTNFWAEPLNFAVRFADEQNYFVILPKSVEDESEKQHYWYSHIAKINVPVFVFMLINYILLLHASSVLAKRVSIFETTTSPKCWTCNMTKDGCSYVDVHFAPKGDHYILYCQGPETPTVHLKSLHSAEFCKAFCSQYGQVDLQRTAVWGWSYGGFAAARIVQMDEFQIFKCASSVAPVTDFRFYDAAYTERYLGLYEDNVVSYEKTNLMKNVTAFKLGKYLLIHGSFDDNVHYQNTAAFISALTANNVNFQLMVCEIVCWLIESI
ncbi:inactive dipeptidyl peptidase 10 [Trichinella spiralis]|uniref:inactive dipeptidyl peptidase 10 n=1 Tax=Trichinella spiralis TaxID=6334 RepID=UPI0001EFEE99|nr:inactive dipeptidyl peptidase 10 [Trichinella spiralis]